MAQDATSGLAPGSTLGEWTLLRKLGEGAMGVVFEASGRTGKNVALKIVRPELLAKPDHAARFRREGKLLRRLEHRNVVKLLDVGEAGGFPFIALSYIEGESLAQRLERGPLVGDEALRLVKDLFRGLAAIHDAGILHRDLKPGNVMLARDGDWKITDFGLARRESDESIVVTRLGAILGTPHYMSPEQCLGEPVDARSDMYSAGATIFHAVAGEPPFKGKRTMDVMQAHVAEKAPDLATRSAGIPVEIAQLVARLLSKQREARPESARAALLFLGSPDTGQALPVAPPPSRLEAGARATPSSAMPRPLAGPSPPSSTTAGAPRGSDTRRFSPPTTTPSTTPSRSSPRPALAAAKAIEPVNPSTQRLALTPSGRIPGVIKASVVRRGRRIPWERATLPLAPALVAALLYGASRVLSHEEPVDGFRSPAFIKLAAAIGASVGLWRVFTGFFEVNASPLAKTRWAYTRALARARATLFRTAQPRIAAQALRDLGCFTEAAHVLLAAGFEREAGAEFLRAGEVVTAAKIFERVNDAQAAVKAYAKVGDTRAAVVALESRRFEEAARIFAKHREFAQSADAWQRAGKPLEAASAFEAAMRLEDAGNEIVRALENPDGVLGQLSEGERHKYSLRAADLFERAGAALAAADRMEKLGEHEVAQQLFEHGGDLAAAARIASSRGDHEKAAELYTRAGRGHEAAKERGIALLAKPGGLSFAATGTGAADPQAILNAARLFEAASEPRRAADLCAQAGDFANAGRLYGLAGAWREASLCFRELGDKEAATRALEQADPIAAAETWAMSGKPLEAMRVLEALPATSPRRGRAAALLGDVHLAAGHKSDAIEAFSAAIEGASASDPEAQKHLGHYADALVGLGRLDRAIEQLTQARRRIGDSPELERVLSNLSARQRTGKGGTELLGCTVDRYRVASLVGEGATAWVYKAEHTFLGRAVALKVLKPHPASETDLADRFYAEAQAVARLKHRNIIHVFDVGSTPGGLLYMALELITGDGLRKRIEGKLRIPPPDAVRIMLGVLSALGAAHELGIVHRDLKPENILLGPFDQPKVVDFGIAKLVVSKVATLTGTFLGTPKYASPEQAQGLEATAASDLYAAGLVLYEMLAGRSPFESETPLGFLTKHATARPTPVSDLVGGLPPPLAAAVMRALEKDPGARWPDVESFRRAIAPYGPPRAAAGQGAVTPTRSLPRPPGLAALGQDFTSKDTIALPGATLRLRMAATGVDLDAARANPEDGADDDRASSADEPPAPAPGAGPRGGPAS